MNPSFRFPCSVLATACAALLLAACGADRPEAAAQGAAGSDAAPAAGGQVNLYTTREPGLIQPLLDAFTAESGIQVNTVLLKDGLVERLGAEGERSVADVLMTVDTGNLLDVVEAGHTQALQSEVLEAAIPQHLRGADGRYRRDARPGGGPVEMHRAGATLRHSAAELRARQVEHVAEDPEQRHVGRHVDRIRLPADVQRVWHVVSCKGVE